MQSYFLGIDWGGTRIKLGAVTPEGEFLHRTAYQTPKCGDIETVVGELMEEAGRLIEKSGGKPLGIGLGLTGPVNPKQGVVHLPGKIKGLAQFPIVSRFSENFGVPVTADNDGKVALYAERFCGLAREVDWATVITVGTGIGSGVMVGGQILDDPHFMFGTQLGHLVIATGDEALCLTGARGTGEMHCSATALALAVRSGLQRGIPSCLSERYFANPHSIDFCAVIEDGVEQGDKLCLDELHRWSTRLGWLIVNAIHAYSSQIVILSGGGTLGAKHFLPQVQAHVDKYIFRYPPREQVPVKLSAIQEHSGVLGAAMMAQHRQKA